MIQNTPTCNQLNQRIKANEDKGFFIILTNIFLLGVFFKSFFALINYSTLISHIAYSWPFWVYKILEIFPSNFSYAQFFSLIVLYYTRLVYRDEWKNYKNLFNVSYIISNVVLFIVLFVDGSHLSTTRLKSYTYCTIILSLILIASMIHIIFQLHEIGKESLMMKMAMRKLSLLTAAIFTLLLIRYIYYTAAYFIPSTINDYSDEHFTLPTLLYVTFCDIFPTNIILIIFFNLQQPDDHDEDEDRISLSSEENQIPIIYASKDFVETYQVFALPADNPKEAFQT